MRPKSAQEPPRKHGVHATVPLAAAGAACARPAGSLAACPRLLPQCTVHRPFLLPLTNLTSLWPPWRPSLRGPALRAALHLIHDASANLCLPASSLFPAVVAATMPRTSMALRVAPLTTARWGGSAPAWWLVAHKGGDRAWQPCHEPLGSCCASMCRACLAGPYMHDLMQGIRRFCPAESSGPFGGTAARTVHLLAPYAVSNNSWHQQMVSQAVQARAGLFPPVESLRGRPAIIPHVAVRPFPGRAFSQQHLSSATE